MSRRNFKHLRVVPVASVTRRAREARDIERRRQALARAAHLL